MENHTPEPFGFIVVAEAVDGNPSPPIYGRQLHDTLDGAADEVHDIAVALGIGGAILLTRDQEKPFGGALTPSGDMWVVRVHPVREVTICGFDSPSM